MKTYRRFLTLALCLLLLIPALGLCAQAKDLDEILKYDITVDVNEDATLHMVYHIDWKVLDSDSEGPLEWVKIGVPNLHHSDMNGLSSAVRRISGMSENGETYARIDLDRAYYAGEVASIVFELTQDYMYQVDMLSEGETVYRLIPGWFDGIVVDEMTVRWNADRAIGHEPDCTVEGGYFTWRKPLAKGEQYRVSVTYPNDAYGFDTTKEILSGTERSGGEGYGGGGGGFAFLGLLVFLVPIALILFTAVSRFNKTANLTGGDKKITRTKVEYYPVCQGCGAARPEGANNCPYCGRSFIKSEEIVEEKDIPAEEKDLRGKTTSGLYRYSHDPNTYIRVNVINVPRPRPIITHGGSHSSRSSGSSHSSSCFHSSCACACACACAGGGRAGCTTKDFYNTDLKLRQLELKKK